MGTTSQKEKKIESLSWEEERLRIGEEWFIECQFKKEDSWNFLEIVSPVGYVLGLSGWN